MLSEYKKVSLYIQPLSGLGGSHLLMIV